jgi:hypothetical protein
MTHTCPMCGHVFQSEEDFAQNYRVVCPSCGHVVREGRPPDEAVFTLDPSFAAEKVAAPAVCLMVAGGLSLVGALFPLLGSIAIQAAEDMAADEKMAASIFYGLLAIYSFAAGGFIFYGGYKMKKLESWGFALTASLLAIIPCNTCCMFSLAIGIWSLIILNDPSVKAAFRTAGK